MEIIRCKKLFIKIRKKILDDHTIIGMNIDRTEIEFLLISKTEDKRLISTNDRYLMEGSMPSIAINGTTKHTLILVDTIPWWAIISNTGEIIFSEKIIPIKGVKLVTPCGSGFAIANCIQGGEVAMVSDKGRVTWHKKFDLPINALDGNNKNLAVSIGNMGYRGQVLLYTKDGEFNQSIDVPLSLSKIKLSRTSSYAIGMLQFVNVLLIKFAN